MRNNHREGPRFPSGCTGSAVWARHLQIDTAHQFHTTDGTSTFKQELERIRYLGTTAASYLDNPLSAHFELHIEQGRQLELAGQTVGVVTGVQGIRWYKVTVTGERAHAGSTPVSHRADSIVAMSQFISRLEREALSTGVFATVGVIEVANASSNVVSGLVHFTIDLRHPREGVLNEIEEWVRKEMKAISQQRDSRIDFRLDRQWHSPAVDFDGTTVQCVREAAKSVVTTPAAVRDLMLSYAGHDSALVARTGTPSAMIFVPSRGGISHAPEEWTSKEHWSVYCSPSPLLFRPLYSSANQVPHD